MPADFSSKKDRRKVTDAANVEIPMVPLGPQATVSPEPDDLSSFIGGLTEAVEGFQMLNAGACAAEKTALVLKGVELVQNLCETYSAVLRGNK